MLPFLAACGTHYAPVKPVPAPLDVPDGALVAPCDVRNGDPETNKALISEVLHTRRQRNDCAAQVDGLRSWRSDALKRADDALKTAGEAPAKQ